MDNEKSPVLKRPSEIIEEYCHKVYKTDCELGRDAAEAIPIPKEAFEARWGYFGALGEFAEVLKAAITFLKEQEHLQGAAGRSYVRDLEYELKDCEEEWRRMAGLDPFQPNHWSPDDEFAWEPTGYADLVVERRQVMAQSTCWLALRYPVCANELRDGLTRLMEAAQRADEPLEVEPVPVVDGDGARPTREAGQDAEAGQPCIKLNVPDDEVKADQRPPTKADDQTESPAGNADATQADNPGKDPKFRPGGKHKPDSGNRLKRDAIRDFVLECLKKNKISLTSTLQEMVDLVRQKTGLVISVPTMSRYVQGTEYRKVGKPASAARVPGKRTTEREPATEDEGPADLSSLEAWITPDDDDPGADGD